MIIDQLPNLASVQATDEIPVERGTTTYKATLDKIAPVRSVNGQTGDVVLGSSVSITVVTSDWTRNDTFCFSIGKLVFVQFYLQGTPSNGKQIATGLPAPKSTVYTAAGSSPSVIFLNANGELSIASAGTGTIIGGAIIYEAR